MAAGLLREVLDNSIDALSFWIISSGPMTFETRCCLKKFEVQRYPPKDVCTARYEHKS